MPTLRFPTVRVPARRLRRSRASLLLILAACFSALSLMNLASAQDGRWTVQTVAFRDFREATDTQQQLRSLGLDAYTQFAMNRGLQYARVRVGCFEDRSAAEAFANTLKRQVTREAVVVPYAPDAALDRCTHVDVGFLKPDRWRVDADTTGTPTFDVQVAGHAARILYSGRSWQLLQDGEPMPELTEPAAGSFEQGALGNAPAVLEVIDGRPTVLCLGKLLAAVGTAAIVDAGDAVVACRFVTTGAGPGATSSATPR